MVTAVIDIVLFAGCVIAGSLDGHVAGDFLGIVGNCDHPAFLPVGSAFTQEGVQRIIGIQAAGEGGAHTVLIHAQGDRIEQIIRCTRNAAAVDIHRTAVVIHTNLTGDRAAIDGQGATVTGCASITAGDVAAVNGGCTAGVQDDVCTTDAGQFAIVNDHSAATIIDTVPIRTAGNGAACNRKGTTVNINCPAFGSGDFTGGFGIGDGQIQAGAV